MRYNKREIYSHTFGVGYHLMNVSLTPSAEIVLQIIYFIETGRKIKPRLVVNALVNFHAICRVASSFKTTATTKMSRFISSSFS